MTVPDQAAAVAPPPELRVDANRVINALKQRLLDEISKAAILEAALGESQERERILSVQLNAAPQAVQDSPG